MKRYRNLVLMGIFFLVFGLIFIVFSSIEGIKDYPIYENRVRVEGIVTDVNYKTRTTYITYNTETSAIQQELKMIDTSMKKDDRIIVFYNKDNPNEFLLKNHLVYIIAFFAIGSLLMVLFAGVFVYVLYSVSRDIKLLKTGTKINCKIESITINRTITRCPYKIVLSYTKGKKTYKFQYNTVWFNIKDIVDAYKIKTVPVYVSKDYKKYYIDLSTLETLNN